MQTPQETITRNTFSDGVKLKTIERTHSELERFHYREVETNAQYAVEGLMDIRREEWEMNFPVREETQQVSPKPTLKYDYKDSSQIHAHLRNLDKRVLALEEKIPGKKNKYKQYIT